MELSIEGLQSLINIWMIGFTAVLAFVGASFSFVLHRLKVRTAESQSVWVGAFFASLTAPVYLMLVAVWLYNLLLAFPVSFQAMFPEYDHMVDVFLSLSVSVAILLLFNKCLSNIQNRIIQIERNQSFPNSGAWLSACKLGRLISAIVFLMVALNMFEVPIGQLLAPTAVGALALSFASKDVLSNVFGGLMVMCDRPFVVGNYVSIRAGEEGTVRAIGWRTTEIQLQNGRILYVPNGLLATTMVTNYSEKSYWFVQKEFGLRYDDIDAAKEIASIIEEWVISHPLANRRRVHFSRVYGLSDSAVVIRVRAYLKNTINTKDWYMFNEELIYKVNEVVNDKKAEFAFPTRTIHIDQ